MMYINSCRSSDGDSGRDDYVYLFCTALFIINGWMGGDVTL